MSFLIKTHISFIIYNNDQNMDTIVHKCNEHLIMKIKKYIKCIVLISKHFDFWIQRKLIEMIDVKILLLLDLKPDMFH